MLGLDWEPPVPDGFEKHLKHFELADSHWEDEGLQMVEQLLAFLPKPQMHLQRH
jgi:hypothetical protein